MTPEAAVARLAEIVAARTEFSEDDIYAAMAADGIPSQLADRAYKFTLFAWGRVFLDGMGANFSPDYLCFDASGAVVESGRLADEPFFIAATRIAERYARTPGFGRLALMSSEAQVLNSALKAGSRPENLVAAPAATFLQVPTTSGIESARRVLAQQTSVQTVPAVSTDNPPKRPWWRFWK